MKNDMSVVAAESWKSVAARFGIGAAAALLLLLALNSFAPIFKTLTGRELLGIWAIVMLGPLAVPIAIVVIASGAPSSFELGYFVVWLVVGVALGAGILSPILPNKNPTAASRASRICTVLWFLFGLCILGSGIT